MNSKLLCRHEDVAHIPLRELRDLLKEDQLSSRQIEAVFRRVNERYQNRDVMTDEELTALGELRTQLTDRMNPYPVEQLDERVKQMNDKFPDYEHVYHRIGKTVTWYDRRREKEA